MPLTHANSPAMTRSPSAMARLSVLLQVLAVWTFRRTSRTSLGRMAPHQLRDIGLDPLSARAEAAKPFWKD